MASAGWTGDVVDRACGALLGLAVGDALGTTLEFTRRDSHPRLTEMTGRGPFGLKPGQWTDDTSMALALADSLLQCGRFEAADVMGRFLAWWRQGRYSCTGACFDIGNTTAAALARFERTGDPMAGSTDEREAGNGSLMRLAPAVLHGLRDEALMLQVAREQSRTTHGAPQAVDGCAYAALMMRDAILGLGDPLRPRPFEGHATIAGVAAGSFRHKTRQQIESSGYVVHTLEAALWAVATTTSFEEALIEAVNLARDADTVGAVTGQIAGAIYGLSAIPQRWLAPLAWRDEIEDTARRLLG